MGSIVSKFRSKKKTTSDLLESIDQQIQRIEKFHKETEQKFRRVVGKFLVFSIIIYVATLIGYYYYFSPDTFRQNIVTFVPVLVLPIIIIFSRKFLSWYYKRKLSKNEATLEVLKADKKRILDEVMDTETYKKAKEILEKYAPEQLRKDPVDNGGSAMRSVVPFTPTEHQTMRNRFTSMTPTPILARQPDFSAVKVSESRYLAVQNTPNIAQARLSLPRPLLQRDRGVFDKLIDMIIGDGPSNRYALICRVCSSHNGMALKHEFEYLAFRCAYCLQWNPARKQKPQGPNLLPDQNNEYPEESDSNKSDEETLESFSSEAVKPLTTKTELQEENIVINDEESIPDSNGTVPFSADTKTEAIKDTGIDDDYTNCSKPHDNDNHCFSPDSKETDEHLQSGDCDLSESFCAPVTTNMSSIKDES